MAAWREWWRYFSLVGLAPKLAEHLDSSLADLLPSKWNQSAHATQREGKHSGCNALHPITLKTANLSARLTPTHDRLVTRRKQENRLRSYAQALDCIITDFGAMPPPALMEVKGAGLEALGSVHQYIETLVELLMDAKSRLAAPRPLVNDKALLDQVEQWSALIQKYLPILRLAAQRVRLARNLQRATQYVDCAAIRRAIEPWWAKKLTELTAIAWTFRADIVAIRGPVDPEILRRRDQLMRYSEFVGALSYVGILQIRSDKSPSNNP
jgi:hypothetical protein